MHLFYLTILLSIFISMGCKRNTLQESSLDTIKQDDFLFQLSRVTDYDDSQTFFEVCYRSNVKKTFHESKARNRLDRQQCHNAYKDTSGNPLTLGNYDDVEELLHTVSNASRVMRDYEFYNGKSIYEPSPHYDRSKYPSGDLSSFSQADVTHFQQKKALYEKLIPMQNEVLASMQRLLDQAKSGNNITAAQMSTFIAEIDSYIARSMQIPGAHSAHLDTEHDRLKDSDITNPNGYYGAVETSEFAKNLQFAINHINTRKDHRLNLSQYTNKLDRAKGAVQHHRLVMEHLRAVARDNEETYSKNKKYFFAFAPMKDHAKHVDAGRHGGYPHFDGFSYINIDLSDFIMYLGISLRQFDVPIAEYCVPQLEKDGKDTKCTKLLP